MLTTTTRLCYYVGMMERVQELLRERQMSQADLARAMGVTPQAVNGYLRREPHPTTLATILRALGYTEAQIQAVRLGEFYSITPESSGNHTGE